MPNYQVHNIISFTAGAGMSYAATQDASVDPSCIATAAGSFVIATLMLSPDLDLKHSSPTRNWMVLRWIWRPYQMLFKHRGLSHSIIFSTVTRMIYLAAVLTTLAIIASFGLSELNYGEEFMALASNGRDFAQAQFQAHLAQTISIGVGIWLSDICHILTDRITSAMKAIFAP